MNTKDKQTFYPATGFTETTTSWITPPQIIERLGGFDLDPCASVPQPWPCAKESYQLPTDGLAESWFGRVWLNPPYTRNILPWIEKMSKHNSGVALLFVRPDTKWFKLIWQSASCFLFISRRILFHRPDGTLSDGRMTASVLIGWGPDEIERLKNCGIEGAFVSNHQWLEGVKVN